MGLIRNRLPGVPLPNPGEVRECGSRQAKAVRRLYAARCSAGEIAEFFHLPAWRVHQIVRYKAGERPLILGKAPR